MDMRTIIVLFAVALRCCVCPELKSGVLIGLRVWLPSEFLFPFSLYYLKQILLQI